MKNFYRQFELNPKASTWSLLSKLEKQIRFEILNGTVNKETIIAFKIFSSNFLRKIYDIKLKNGFLNLRVRQVLHNALNNNLQMDDYQLQQLFSEKLFLAQNAKLIVFRSLGLDFLVASLEDRFEFADDALFLGPLSRFWFTGFWVHSALYYGVPVLLGILNPFFWLLLIPVFALKLNHEYKRRKIEYYRFRIKWLLKEAA